MNVYCESSGSTETERLPWYALQVWSRKEAYVLAHLKGQGYESFLPTRRIQKKWSDRRIELEQPLFPGYLFCRFNFQNRRPLVMIPGVVQIVGYNRQAIPVDENEIKAIQALVASGVPNQPCPYLEIGEQVRIESGPLRGLEGILVEFKGDQRLILSVTLLQRSVAVELDYASVISLRCGQLAQVGEGHARQSAA